MKYLASTFLFLFSFLSVFGQGLVRYSVTTNGVTANLAANHVLTWDAVAGRWTNAPAGVATATNAIANLAGFGTNTTIYVLTSATNFFGQGTSYFNYAAFPKIAANTFLMLDANSNVFGLASGVLTNLVGTVANNVTNVVSLSTTNTTSKPLTNSYANGVLTLFGLEEGANITLTPNGSNIVISTSGAVGEANVNGEVSLTNNANGIYGLVYDKVGITNRLKSVSQGNGIIITNNGTNLVLAATTSGGAPSGNAAGSTIPIWTNNTDGATWRIAAPTNFFVTPRGGVMLGRNVTNWWGQASTPIASSDELIIGFKDYDSFPSISDVLYWFRAQDGDFVAEEELYSDAVSMVRDAYVLSNGVIRSEWNMAIDADGAYQALYGLNGFTLFEVNTDGKLYVHSNITVQADGIFRGTLFPTNGVSFSSTNLNGRQVHLRSGLIASNTTILMPTNAWGGITDPIAQITSIVGDANGTTGQLSFMSRSALQSSEMTLSNLVGTVAKNVTNVVSLSTTNSTSKPITNSYANGVLTLFGLEEGANITLTPNGSNIVIATAGTVGEANVNGEVSLTNNANGIYGLVYDKVGITNRIKSISAGSNIVITNAGTNLWIASTATGSGTISLSNAVFVTKNGSDSTGTRGKLDLPFFTIDAARLVARTNDTVIVYPGIYTNTTPINFSNMVSFEFIGKGQLFLTNTLTNAIFSDGGVANLTNTVFAPNWIFTARTNQKVIELSQEGLHYFNIGEAYSDSNHIAHITNNAVAKLVINRFVTTNASSAIAQDFGSKLDLTVDYGEAMNGAVLTPEKSDLNVHAGTLLSSFYDGADHDTLSAVFTLNSTASNHIYVSADRLHSSAGWTVWISGTSSNVFFDCKHISAGGDCTVVSSCTNLIVRADLISNTNSGTYGILNCEGGFMTAIGCNIVYDGPGTPTELATTSPGGVINLIATTFNRTFISEFAAGTIRRIDTNFLSGLYVNSGLINLPQAGSAVGQVWTLTNTISGLGAWSNVPASAGGDTIWTNTGTFLKPITFQTNVNIRNIDGSLFNGNGVDDVMFLGVLGGITNTNKFFPLFSVAYTNISTNWESRMGLVADSNAPIVTLLEAKGKISDNSSSPYANQTLDLHTETAASVTHVTLSADTANAAQSGNMGRLVLDIQGTTNDIILTATNAGSVIRLGATSFVVTNDGNISRIRNVDYTWPLANAAGMFTNDGAGVLGWMTIPSGGSGGTNYPPIIANGGGKQADTNITVGVGVRKVRTIVTNASFALVLTGTPLNGEEVEVGVSNLSSSTIYWTNTAGIFSPSVASNVTVFAVPGTSAGWWTIKSSTNWNVGTARWELHNFSGKEFELAAGSNVTFTTNAANSTITIAATGGSGSTNNVVEADGNFIITNSFFNLLKAAFSGPVTTTNYLYATNGDSQFYNLGASTNLQYVPYTGADASNHVGVWVQFTQNGTGGYYPTNNGQLIPVITNASRSTMVSFSYINGATNVGVAYPFSMGAATNLDIIEFNSASGMYTNAITMGTGPVTRSNTPAMSITTLGVGTANISVSDNASSATITNTATATSFKNVIFTNLVNTVSNFVFAFTTNRYELKNQTNVVFTNIVEEATQSASEMAVHVHNTTGVTMGLVWPAYGAQHGYYFQTNINNPILSYTSLTTGKHGVASFSCFGTNIFATWTEWP